MAVHVGDFLCFLAAFMSDILRVMEDYHGKDFQLVKCKWIEVTHIINGHSRWKERERERNENIK